MSGHTVCCALEGAGVSTETFGKCDVMWFLGLRQAELWKAAWSEQVVRLVEQVPRWASPLPRRTYALVVRR